MLKKYLKITLAFLVLIIALNGIVANLANADYRSEMSTAFSNVDKDVSNDANEKVKSVVGVVITIARIVGVAVAITMLLVVAMKYMTAAPGEKADIKKSAVVYVVGAFILFAVTGILGLINQFSSNIKVN